MAEACVSTADEDDEVDGAIQKIFEIAPFMWNKKDECETNQPEVASNVDESYSKIAERLVFKISCVGPFGVRWSKGVFIQDYASCNGAIKKNPDNSLMIEEYYAINLNYMSGQKIQLDISNLAESQLYFGVYKLFLPLRRPYGALGNKSTLDGHFTRI